MVARCYMRRCIAEATTARQRDGQILRCPKCSPNLLLPPRRVLFDEGLERVELWSIRSRLADVLQRSQRPHFVYRPVSLK